MMKISFLWVICPKTPWLQITAQEMPSMEKVSCSEETVGEKHSKKAGTWWQLTFISGDGYVKSCQLNKNLLPPPKKPQ